MAISRKPTRAVPPVGVDVDALINKGGSSPSRVAEDSEAPKNEATAAVVLRLPTGLLAQVDTIIKARPVRIPRHTWLIEAVYEKIQRDGEPAS